MPLNRAVDRKRRRARVFGLPAPVAPLGPAFPANPLSLTVELFINGTWTDVSTYVYTRDKVAIKRGRPDEASNMTVSTLQLTFDNRDGRFSPRNTAGAYYPYIGRNTQIRVSVNASSAVGVGYSGYRFSGEVSAWPPRWDTTGTDVYAPVSAAGVWRRFQQGSNVGSPIRRYIMQRTGAYVPVAYWPMEEPTEATQFGNLITPGNSLSWGTTPGLASDSEFPGSDPLPLISKAILTGSTGSFSSTGDDVFTAPGTHNWVATFTGTVTAKVWGASGGGGGGFQQFGSSAAGGRAGGGGEFSQQTVSVTQGNIYPVVVGSGGQGGSGRSSVNGFLHADSGSAGGDSSFTGDSAKVTAHGGDGGPGGASGSLPGAAGLGGTGSTAPTHFDGGSGGGGSTGSGSRAGGGGGSSAGTAAPGNPGGNATGGVGGAGASPPAGGGRGGGGWTAGLGGGSPIQAQSGAVPGGGGGAGGASASTYWDAGASGAAGKVELVYTPVTAPQAVVMRCVLAVPAAGAVNGAVLLKGLISSGTLARIEMYYGTGGLLGFRGLDSGSVTKFDTGLISFSVNATPCLMSMELVQSGASIAYALKMLTIGQTFQSVSGSFAGTLGAVSQAVVNPAGTVDDTAIGHIHVQYALDSLTNLGSALAGYNGERAGDRFTRLCREANITSVFRGSVSDTPLMGVQLNRKLTELLQEIEDADQGILYEPRETFGLGYRTRISLTNQASVLDLDYALTHLAGTLEPATDDQQTRNDVTVNRVNGASVNVQLTSPSSQWQVTGQGTTGTLADGTGPLAYVILSNADAAFLSPGDTFTDNFNPGQTFTVMMIEPPFVGFNNVHFYPYATTAMNAGDVLTQVRRTALSTADPPQGVGDYPFSLSANVQSDTQIGNLAAWLLAVGTVDEYRYPVVSVDQSRPATARLFGQIGILDVGDFFRIFNPPPWLPFGPIKQLAFGFSETLWQYEWSIDINAVPESPYEGTPLTW